jgi:hypothetical protein
MQKKTLLLILILSAVVLSLLASSGPIEVVEAQEPEPEYYRGHNYETYTYPNGTVKWRSKRQAVYNGTHWVEYIFKNRYATDGYLQVQAGLIGARLYEGKIVYYDPNFTRMAVGRENWIVLKKMGNTWEPRCASLGQYFDSVNFQLTAEEYMEVTGSWSTAAGTLTITLLIDEKLKHTVEFEASQPGKYVLAQVWNDTVYDKVKLQNATIIHRASDKIIGKSDSLTVLFFNDTQPFGILEDQRRAEENYLFSVFANGTLHKEIQGANLTIHNGVAWIFGTWDLQAGQTLSVDPSSSTHYAQSSDGYIRYRNGVYETLDSSGDYLIAGEWYSTYWYWYRVFFRFDISSVGADKKITYARVYSYHHDSAESAPAESMDCDLDRVSDMGSSLDSSDWNLVELRGPSGDFVTGTGSPPRWESLNVYSPHMCVDNGQNYNTFRLKGEVEDSDGDWRYWRFRSTEYAAGSSYDPYLSLQYSVAAPTNSFGYKDAGPNQYDWNGGNDIVSTKFTTPSVDGDLYATSVTAYVFLDNGIPTFKGGIYKESDLSYTIGSGSTSVSPSGQGWKWVTCTFTSTKLEENTDYRLCIWSSGDMEVHYTSGSMGQSARDVQTYGAWPSTYSKDLTQNYKYSIFCSYDIITNQNPTIGEFEAPSTVYSLQEVMLNATVSDPDGNTTLKNTTLTLSADNIVLKWINSTNTFSMNAPNNKWELVSGSRSDVNSTAYKLTWTVKSYWNSTEGYVSISSATVYDTQEASGTNSESNWFYNENDLIINSANVDDSVVNPSQSLSFTGQIYYQNTSTAPYTTNAITAKIELSTVLKGSNSSIAADGSFIISFNAESTIAQHSYNMYSTTTKNSIQNQTVNVIVERVNITITANTTTPWTEETVDFQVTALYEYYGTSVTSWTVNILRNSTHFATGNFTDQQNTGITYEYTAENVTETLYGLSTFTSNTQTVTWLGRYDLNLRAVDWEDNVLTEATIYMNNGTEYSKTVDSQGWTNWTHITASSVDVYVTWYDYTVNETFTITMDSHKTLDVTCKCYPFTLDGTRYWIAGDATVDSHSWDAATKEIVITFTGAGGTYTLKSSASSKPTYILNGAYDIDTDWTAYLTLSHDGDRKITIAYPNWASTRIYRTDDYITNIYWASEGEKLYVVLSGTSGQSGTLEVYCGSRGTPESTSGLSDTVYFSSTTILAGTYSFSSTATVEIDWTTQTGGSSGGSTTTPSIFATAETLDIGTVQQGTIKTFNATATWSGRTSITLADVTFTGLGSGWLKHEVDTPLTIQRLAIETTGTIEVPITITVPREAKLGDYTVLIEYKIQVGTRTYETTANLMWTVTATPIPPAGIPQIISILLLISLVAVVFISVGKR